MTQLDPVRLDFISVNPNELNKNNSHSIGPTSTPVSRVKRISVQSYPGHLGSPATPHRKSASIATCVLEEDVNDTNSMIADKTRTINNDDIVNRQRTFSLKLRNHQNEQRQQQQQNGSRIFSRYPSDPALDDAEKCRRYHGRRNALAHPLTTPRIPQETRERIQKDNTIRKASLTRRVSQFFKTSKIHIGAVEVDLI